jgi:large subunit ribosomal protein L18
MNRNVKKRRVGYNIRAYNKRMLPRISVYRSNSNLYAQIIDDQSGKTLCFANTIEKDFKESGKGYNIEGAKQLGRILGQRAKEKQIEEAVFDRSGYLYHGRIAALADGAREFIKI